MLNMNNGPLYVVIPSEKNYGRWCVAKKFFPGNPVMEKYRPLAVEYRTREEAQTQADILNQKAKEDEAEYKKM